MIAVIADDFTGAAEIGGVGLRYGLNVLIETEVNKVEGIDLLVIATDTRSLSADAAFEEVTRITGELLQLEPVFIFKKIDSVLRGHVTKELEAQMLVEKKNKAIIVAPNPSVGRTIVKGQYFIDSSLLHETSFADDPEFPVNSADVTAIVKPSEYGVSSINMKSELDGSGMMIADVTGSDDLSEWASMVSQEMVVAGGSGFFDALLAAKYSPKVSADPPDLSFGEGSLFIFGSMYPKQEDMFEKFYRNKVAKLSMPEGIYYDKDKNSLLLNKWTSQIVSQLKKGNSVMVTIDHHTEYDAGLSLHLRESIGQMVAKVENLFELKDLFIEGGATTSAILKHLHITTLLPFNEADFGIIQMKAEGYLNLCITTKPGSYLWPEHTVFEKNNQSID